MWLKSETARYYVQALGLVSLLCFALLGLRAQATGTTRYWFIPENLLLAWAGLAFGWLLVRKLQTKRWLSWQNIVLSVLWLFFLPNTWYVITDYLHVYATGEISQLYDIVLVGTLVIVGFTLGFTSLYLVHREILKRLSSAQALAVIELVILFSSFAIYLGRILRWNSWDLVTNTSGLIINVSDRVSDPAGNPHALNITGLFFVLLSVIYYAIYRISLSFSPSVSRQ